MKLCKFLLSAAMLGALTFTCAFAADSLNGICDVKVEDAYASSVTFTPLTASDDTAVTPDTSTDKTIYPDTVRLKVAYSNPVADAYYVVMVKDSSENITYIDQVAATNSANSVAFVVYPSTLKSGEAYTVYLSSNAASGITSQVKVGSFSYYVSYILGDVDDNQMININDVMAIINYIAQKQSLTDVQLSAADVNQDGYVNINDAMEIINYVADKRGPF